MRRLDKAFIQEVKETLQHIDALKHSFEEKACEALDYADERSDKWQESEAGHEYHEWMGEIEDMAITLDQVVCALEGLRQSPKD